jgi:hypothetical protein
MAKSSHVVVVIQPGVVTSFGEREGGCKRGTRGSSHGSLGRVSTGLSAGAGAEAPKHGCMHARRNETLEFPTIDLPATLTIPKSPMLEVLRV